MVETHINQNTSRRTEANLGEGSDYYALVDIAERKDGTVYVRVDERPKGDTFVTEFEEYIDWDSEGYLTHSSEKEPYAPNTEKGVERAFEKAINHELEEEKILASTNPWKYWAE